MKLTVNTVGIDGCEIADRRDSSMRNGAREVDMTVGTLVRYRVHSNFILPQEQIGPWHLEGVVFSGERETPRRKAVASERFLRGVVFVAATVRLHGTRPWHLGQITIAALTLLHCEVSTREFVYVVREVCSLIMWSTTAHVSLAPVPIMFPFSSWMA